MIGGQERNSDDVAPSTALLEHVLAQASEVLIVEAYADEIDEPDAARTMVSGEDIGQLARRLAVVDGGTGDHCLCMGWPTILVSDGAGREIACWTLHHQTGIRGLGNCDAELLDGPGLTDWLADRGLTRSREVQQVLAREAAETEERRAEWVAAAPPGLTEAAERASRGEPGAEEALAGLVVRLYAEPIERIRALTAWAGFPPRCPRPSSTVPRNCSPRSNGSARRFRSRSGPR
ncbi:hypothetical protein ACQP2X_21750 [Actinoplanes sp. CA-131856]